MMKTMPPLHVWLLVTAFHLTGQNDPTKPIWAAGFGNSFFSALQAAPTPDWLRTQLQPYSLLTPSQAHSKRSGNSHKLEKGKF